jgi:hypothetical protein
MVRRIYVGPRLARIFLDEILHVIISPREHDPPRTGRFDYKLIARFEARSAQGVNR